MKTQIKNWVTDEIIAESDTMNLKELVEHCVSTKISLNGAELNYAELNGAKLNGAKLNYAELNYAKLNDAELNYAELNYAELNGAELNYAKLNDAELNYAKLNYANIDFSSWPLWCGSLKVILDNRIKAQLLYHCIAVIGIDKFTQDQIDFANTFHRVQSQCVPKLTK